MSGERLLLDSTFIAGLINTEPSAVAPDARVSFKAVLPRLIAKVDSSIRRYRARFCNHNSRDQLHLQAKDFLSLVETAAEVVITEAVLIVALSPRSAAIA